MKKIIYAFSIILSLAACETQVNVEVPLPTFDPQPVIICFASISQQTLAYIGQTITLDSDLATAPNIQVSAVRIMQGSEVVGVLVPDLKPGLFTSQGIIPFKDGVNYHIEVETLEFGLIKSKSEQIVPPIILDSVSVGIPNINQQGTFNVSCHFLDHPAINNYYSIGTLFYAKGIEVFQNSEYLHLPLAKFTDLGFDGQPMRREVPVSKRVGSSGNISIVEEADMILYHLSPSLFSFFSSITQNEGTFSDVLLQPIPVVSNIENGHGVFGFFQSDTLRIEF